MFIKFSVSTMGQDLRFMWQVVYQWNGKIMESQSITFNCINSTTSSFLPSSTKTSKYCSIYPTTYLLSNRTLISPIPEKGRLPQKWKEKLKKVTLGLLAFQLPIPDSDNLRVFENSFNQMQLISGLHKHRPDMIKVRFFLLKYWERFL